MGKSWAKTLQKRVNGWEAEVGILNDKPHREPVYTTIGGQPQLTDYAGQKVRKTSRIPSGKSTGEILVDTMKRLNQNILLEPFQKRNSDIIKFTEYFLKFVVSGMGGAQKRVENLLQAIVRNPILNKEYGDNDPKTADAKGFDHLLLDTGQMFKEIRARVMKRGSNV